MTSKDEQKHLNTIAALGCVVCRNENLGETPPEIHHRRSGYGVSEKAPHVEAIPLCHWHHRIADGTTKFEGHISYHVSPERFEDRYGTENALLDQTRGECPCKLCRDWRKTGARYDE